MNISLSAETAQRSACRSNLAAAAAAVLFGIALLLMGRSGWFQDFRAGAGVVMIPGDASAVLPSCHTPMG